MENIQKSTKPFVTFSRRTKKQDQIFTMILFLLAPILLLFVFTYIPVFNMFGYSLNKWDGYSKAKEFIGLQNYIELFTRPELFRVFGVSIYYFVASFIQLALALYFATILSFDVRLKNFFKGVLFFPYLINGVAVGFIFLYFFKPDGVLDLIMVSLGLGDYVQQWLGNRAIINYSLAGVSIWRYMGLNFVMFMGAIQSIPSEIYEASSLDGANRWQQFKHIIFPSIFPIISLSLLLAIRGSLAVFEIPYIMTGGANGSSTFVIQTVDMAFKNQKFGLASAMAVVLLLITLILAGVQNLIFKDKNAGSN
ncbi:MAG TPA: sugar ABC transporter permease [Anaerolineaceae bacterium]|nr:sugar ABC transporter permease [Anaerolineaceae bacterium]HPN53144.1 sugar ABC transporter permease [Anaerolineaceae bacterium]